MTYKFIITIIVATVFFSNIIAQNTDSLINKIQENLPEIAEFTKKQELNQRKGFANSIDKFVDVFINTELESETVEFIIKNYSNNSLLEIRSFAAKVLHIVAEYSNDSIVRQKSLHTLLVNYLNPSISQLFINDFDMYAKIVLSFDNAKQQIYDLEISKFKEKALKPTTDLWHILDAGQLNIREVIPYLIEYANNNIYDENVKKYAICSLATMQVDDYEERAAQYFDIDTYANDISLATKRIFINKRKKYK